MKSIMTPKNKKSSINIQASICKKIMCKGSNASKEEHRLSIKGDKNKITSGRNKKWSLIIFSWISAVS